MASHAIVETIDIFPTLTDLTGLPAPEELEGLSLREQLENPEAVSRKPAFGHWTRGQVTVRDEEWQLIVNRPEGGLEGFELFDFRENQEGVRKNPDEHPEVVNQLLELLDDLTE